MTLFPSAKTAYPVTGEVLSLPPAVTPEQKIDLLYQVESLTARLLTGKHLGLRHDDLPTLEHVADAFFQPLVDVARPVDECFSSLCRA